MKYYTVNTLEQLNAIPLIQHIQSYKFEDWQKHKDTRDKFAEIGVNVEISASVSETGYYEGCCATIDAPYPVRVVPPTRYNNGKYTFYLVPIFVTRSTYTEEPPQRVGVPTAKKVNAWVEYLQRKAAWLAERDNAKDTLITTNLAKLNAVGIVARIPSYTNQKMVFTHEKDGISLTGEIDLETGAMYTDVKVTYSANNLEGYCKLVGLVPTQTV
jgi:hypothetical protein